MKKKKNNMDLGYDSSMNLGDMSHIKIDSGDIKEMSGDISKVFDLVKKGYGAGYSNKVARYFEKKNLPQKIRRAKIRIFRDNLKNKNLEKNGVDWFKLAPKK